MPPLQAVLSVAEDVVNFQIRIVAPGEYGLTLIRIMHLQHGSIGVLSVTISVQDNPVGHCACGRNITMDLTLHMVQVVLQTVHTKTASKAIATGLKVGTRNSQDRHGRDILETCTGKATRFPNQTPPGGANYGLAFFLQIDVTETLNILTPREREVLKLLAEGKTYDPVAVARTMEA